MRAGVAALRSWAESRAPEFEAIAERRDLHAAEADRALEIVRLFAIERGLVLFGGLAIDYALRLRGARLYPDEKRPDYDLYSPRSVDDAYDLADRLGEAGFERVGVVRGVHVQTMRVRAAATWVADLGYYPPAAFAAIPTLTYRGLRFVHPDFQRMDLHLAFCFPFANAPREDIFNRWRKDIRRFNLLDSHYPVEARGAAPGPGPGERSARLPVPLVGRGRWRPCVALHGFAAYAALRAELDGLTRALGAAPPALAAPRLELSFPDAHTVTVGAPQGAPPAFATPWPARATEGLAARRHYPYVGFCPMTYQTPDLVVHSTSGRRLAVSCVSVRGPTDEPWQAFIVTPQYLLVWLLGSAQRAEGAAREDYRAYYAHTLEILGAAESLYADAVARAGGDAQTAALASFAASPFAPGLATLGCVDQPPAYLLRMADAANQLGDEPPPALGLPSGLRALLRGLPANYYPAPAKIHPSFDYGSNPLFALEGEPMPGEPPPGEPSPGEP